MIHRWVLGGLGVLGVGQVKKNFQDAFMYNGGLLFIQRAQSTIYCENLTNVKIRHFLQEILFKRFPWGRAALAWRKNILRPSVRSWFVVKSNISSVCRLGQEGYLKIYTVKIGAKKKEKPSYRDSISSAPRKITYIIFWRNIEVTETCLWCYI